MATLEKIIIKIFPMDERKQPYVITCEHTAPSFLSSKLQDRILQLLKEEFIAEGVQHIRAEPK